MSLNNFFEKIGPEVKGIFWITTAPIESRPELFNQIDYLLNGILTLHLLRNSERKMVQDETSGTSKENDRKKFFMAHNFGKPFFVAHIEAQGQSLSKDFEGLMQLFIGGKNQKHISEDPDKTIIMILIDGSLNKQIDVKELHQRFQGFSFKLIQ